MYYLSEFCLLCLKSKNLESVLMLDEDGIEMQEQLLYCLPEITISKSEITKFICSFCRATVQTFYKFRKMSLENYNRLKQYRQIVKGSSDPRGQKFSKLQIQIKNLDLMMEPQQAVDSESNVKEEIEDSLQSLEEEYDQEAEVIDNVNIKEELIANSEDYEFYLKHVKYEPASDNKQDSVSRGSCEDDDQQNVDETNFSADTINVNASCSLYAKKFVHENSSASHMEMQECIRDYTCSVCNKKFLYKSTLKRHIKMHRGILDHKCSICDKKFARKEHLTRHMKSHSGIRDHKCSLCDKMFVQKEYLTKHMKSHTGIRNHKCSLCDKMFVQKEYLTQHMKSHTGIKDHKCSICDKKFTQRRHLTRHIKLHTGIRDHKCSLCDKMFVQKKHLTQHMKSHTARLDHKCSVCDMKFRYKRHVVLHMKIH